jgi:hypothetical protein
MIVDPWFGEDDPELVADKIRETLLWYFWPKMLSYDGEPPAMTFRVELEGQDRPIPSPEEFPPLDLFSRAMRQLKEDTDPEAAIWCQRPRKLLGRLVIEKGMRSARLNLVPEDQSLIPRHCYHMAVMRPVELVVRYFEGHPLPDERVEWAGVFVCDSDDGVEAAFSAAEPPAHDDWIPDGVPKPGSTYVRVALRHIRERINAAALVGTTVAEGGGGVQLGLAKAADALGRALVPAGLGTSAGQGGRNGGAGGRSGSNRSRARLQGPTFRELVLNGDQPAALFDLRLTASLADDGSEAVIEGEAFFVADGAAMRDADDGEDGPRVIAWYDKDGTELAAGTSISVPARDTELRMLVSIPAPGAVGANARLVSSGSA